MSDGYKIYASQEHIDGLIATDEDIMNVMTEMEMVEPVTTSNGAILISNNNEIYSL